MAYGYDPTNPDTQIINGQLYTWQPSTAGQDAAAYLGANADPALVNQDTSPASGNGSWVPGTYDNPNGQFWSLLAKVLASTSLGEYGLYSILGDGATAGAAGTAGAGGTAGAAGAGTTIAPLTTTTLGGSLPGLSTVSLPAVGTAGAAGAGAAGSAGAGGAGAGVAGAGSTIAKNLVDKGQDAASTLPSWLKPAIALAAPTLSKLTGGGTSDLTNSLESALTGLIPDIKQSYELGIQRQQQASPLYDAVLKMALGRLPNWSTGGGQ